MHKEAFIYGADSHLRALSQLGQSHSKAGAAAIKVYARCRQRPKHLSVPLPITLTFWDVWLTPVCLFVELLCNNARWPPRGHQQRSRTREAAAQAKIRMAISSEVRVNFEVFWASGHTHSQFILQPCSRFQINVMVKVLASTFRCQLPSNGDKGRCVTWSRRNCNDILAGD